MSAIDIGQRPFDLDIDLGPFPDVDSAISALQAQGLAGEAEALGFPSGRWWITQARARAVKCADCWATTWSSTGFCPTHLLARGYQNSTTKST